MKPFASLLIFLLVFEIGAKDLLKSADLAPQGRSTSQVVETGKFRFYETKQIRGEETYEITRADKGGLIVSAKTDLPFAEQEKKPLVNTILRMKADFTPQSFESKGIALLEIEQNTSVVVQGKTATVKEGDRPDASTDVPDIFFTISRYIPVAVEMMLVRYWLALGRPNSIRLLPRGEAFVEYRGKDTVALSGKPTVLTRYHLSGNNWPGAWGRQTLWLDSENRLVAAVNLGSDIETNLYAIRDGYDSAISFFLKRTVEDGIDRLTQVADQLSPKNESPLVLLGATLIDVTGKTPIPNSAVIINGDRIIAAGPRSQIKIPDGAKTVDVSGKFLLPGLWDMHSHFYQVEFGPTYLAAGITTARDVGNEIEFGTALRDAAKQRRGLGPRMLLAGYIDGKNPYQSFDIQVETPEKARAAVQHYKNAGYEQIKIRDNVKLDTLKAITAEAHRLGMTVTGHVPKSMNAIEAVAAGMDQINHLNFVAPVLEPQAEGSQGNLSNELNSPRARQSLNFLKDHGTVIDPTMAMIELSLRPQNKPIETFEPGLKQVAPELLEQINQKGSPAEAAQQMEIALQFLLNIIGTLHREGIPIVAGTDVGVPGHTLHRELELYVKAGLTPLEAIQAATLTPARVMKVENEVGTIEAGKRADIIILDANPLDNIRNIRKVRFVVAQGRLFESAKLWESVGFRP